MPAHAVEYPQREIMNVIGADPNLTPTNSDLTQLLQAIKYLIQTYSNVIPFVVDSGTVNNYVGAFSPAISSLTDGMLVQLRINNTNTSTTCHLQANSTASLPIVDGQGAGPAVGLLLKGYNALFSYNASIAAWQIISITAPKLTAAATFYVNASTGSDTLYDGTSATVVGGTAHGPWASLTHAVATVSGYNLNGYNITINVTGAFTGQVTLPQTTGTGTILIVGNSTQGSPNNCTVTSQNTAGACAFLQTGGNWGISGVNVSAPGSAYDGVCCAGGNLTLSGTMIFGACGRAHMTAQGSGSNLTVASNTILVVSGNATYHMNSTTFGIITTTNPPSTQYPTLVITTAVSINQWAYAFDGFLFMLYNSITGGSNVTGQKYQANMLGAISVLGQSVSYYPGGISGGTSNGGVYA